MTNTNEAYRRAANSPTARQAAETARNIGEVWSDFASDVSRKAGKQFDRAQDMASMPCRTRAMRCGATRSARWIAAGLGFLLGAFAMGRR